MSSAFQPEDRASIPGETEAAAEAHFADFMAKFMAAGEVARAARSSGWEMSLFTNSETITLNIKQLALKATTAASPDLGGDDRAAGVNHEGGES